MRYFLAKDAVLRWLETPSVYHLKKDELYDLDEEGYNFLALCAASGGGESDDRAFLDYCLSEGILAKERPCVERPAPGRSPLPSLRYFELQITDRCNLRCRHCYIGGSPRPHELSVGQVRDILSEFDRMQGLRVLLTGGEPLLHSHFDEINRMLPEFSLRKVLFSNGLLISREMAGDLQVDEVQVSVDGMKAGHEALRGVGTFNPALRAIETCRDAGLDVSVSTMVHPGNLGDFDEMERLFREMGAKDWTVDIPCSTGSLKENVSCQVSPEEGGKFLRYGYGGGIHSSSPGYGCGLHLMSVSADGRVSKCTFYSDRPVGGIGEGLKECWQRIRPVSLDDLSCDCSFLDACRGGCRYRAELAGDASGKDPFRCSFYDIMDTRE